MQNINLCQRVETIPPGEKTRQWVLNDSTNSNFHNIVHLGESPLYLHFSWRRSARDPIQFVGIFKLDLPGLLQYGYVRLENDEPNNSNIRLRIKHKIDGIFYIQVNDNNPSLLMNAISPNNDQGPLEMKNQVENPKINKNEIDQLIISKQIFLHGIEHSKKSGQINRMIAIHNIHNSIEILLRGILYTSDKKFSDYKFDELIGEANVVYQNKVGKEFPLMKKIKSLNSQRNMVQHDADDPSIKVVEKYSIYTRTFLEEVYQNYYDLDFDNVSLIEFIQNQEIKSLLHLAQKNFFKDINKSMILLSRAFYLGINSVSQIFKTNYSNQYLPSALSWIDLLTTQGEVNNMIKYKENDLLARAYQQPYGRQKNEVRNSIINMMSGLEYYIGTQISIVGSGIDLFEYNKFKELTDKWSTIFSSNKNGKFVSIYWPKKPMEVITIEQTEELLFYVVNTLFGIESKGIELTIHDDYLEFFRILTEWDTSKINIHEVDA
jgi:hypothetical protein